jgi:hypothetical protein
MAGAVGSTALLIVGVKTEIPILSGIAVAIASFATLAKFAVGRKDRRSRNSSLPNAPRRRTEDHDHAAVL